VGYVDTARPQFYSSVRLDIRRTGAIKKGDEVIGN
jgi:recA bacterial DNA recombination protein.